jgi:HlyD family secretion protein
MSERRPSRRRQFAASAALVVAAGVTVAIASPFGGGAKAGAGVSDNPYPTSTVKVKREALSSEAEVPGTLGYANAGNAATATNVVVPAGTSASTVQQAEQQVTSARQALAADQAALQTTNASNDDATVQQDQAIQAARAALAADETALRGTGGSNATALAQATQSVSADRAALAADETALRGTGGSNATALAQATQTVSADRAALAADQAAVQTTRKADAESLAQVHRQLANARSTLETDQSTLGSDEAALSAGQQKESVDCRGEGAAGSARGSSGNGSSPTTVCATDEAEVAQAEGIVSSDNQKVANDKATAQADLANVVSTGTTGTQSLQQAQSQVSSADAQLGTAELQVAAAEEGNTKSAQQAQAQVTAAQHQLTTAELQVAAVKEGNTKSAQQAQAQVAAAQDQLSAAIDAAATTGTTNTKSAQQAQVDLTGARLTLAEDESALAADQADLALGGGGGGGGTDNGSTGNANSGDSSTGADPLAADANASPTYTELANVGQVIARGQELFAINDQPSLLLYGNVIPWRAFVPGMSPGTDVGALNSNLEELGYGANLRGDSFSGATEAAIKKLQATHGQARSGQLALGSVLFQPGPVQVTAVNPDLGQIVSTGEVVLTVTTTKRQVQVALDASQQTQVAVGDKVSIVLPDNSVTPGVVSYVSKVAVSPSSSSSGSSSPTIIVYVTPTDPEATGTLDDVPVNVWITEASVASAYVVPVDALVALASGAYAIEVVSARGVHDLEPVSLGLFDDADGLVQVSGPEVQARQTVVVPGL